MKIENKNWNDIVYALRNHPSDIDLDKQWAALELSLDRKKKRRFLLFLIIGMGIFTAALISFVYPSITKRMDQHNVNKNAFAHNTSNFNENRNHVNNNNVKELLANVNTNKNTELITKKTVKISNGETSYYNQKFPETTFEFKSNEEENHVLNNQTLVKEEVENESAIEEEIMPLEALPILHTFIEGNLADASEILLPIKVQKKRNNMWLDFTTSFGLHTNTIKPLNHQSEVILKSTIKPLENFSLKGSLGKALYKKIYVTSGLQYQRYNDVLSRSMVQNETNTLDDQLVEVYTNSQGEVLTRYADITVSTTSTIKEKRYNQHHILNIDLGLGYTVNIGGHGRLQVELGAGKCLWLHQKGYIQNSDDQLVKLSDVSIEIPSFNYYSSIHYNCSLGSNYFLLLGYNFNTFNYRYQALYDVQVKNNSIDFTLRKLLN